MTMLLVLGRNQLEGYENNIFRLVRMARSLGYLRWKPQFPERLSAIELPSEETAESFLDFVDTHLALEHVELLRLGHRLAVIGRDRQNEITENIVRHLSPAERVSFHFTTGLKWSKQRPYCCHMLQSIDHKTRIRFKSDNVRVVKANFRSV